jgi:hypothetical protein
VIYSWPHPCQGQDLANGVTAYAQHEIMKNVNAGAKMYATQTNSRLIYESMPREVVDDQEATRRLKLAISAKLENLKGRLARRGTDSADLWYLNMADETASANLLATLLGARWSSVLSQGSVARVIKEYMKVPAKIVGVEVCLARRFGVTNRHQEQLRIKFEYDSDDVSTITCPTGYSKGHGLPGPATAYALQLAYEKTK